MIARKLGKNAQLIGQVGDDAFEALALKGLAEVGVDLRAVRHVQQHATGTALIVVRKDGEKTILWAANANEWRGPDTEQELLQTVTSAAEGSVLAVDLEISTQAVLAAARSAKRLKLSVIIDPSPALRFPEELYALADFITPNPSEAEKLTGIAVHSIDDALLAGRKLLERGAQHACVKLKDGGCVLIADGKQTVVEALSVEVVDKTGAGDAFAGALAVSVLERRSAREAVRRAVAAASLAVTGYGSRTGYPDAAELERALRDIRETT